MSADNWAICPKCYAAKEAAREQAILSAGKSYGKVAPSEYVEAASEAQKACEHEQTFREDYEIGMGKDGEFSVGYSGQCSACRFAYKFNHGARALLAQNGGAK